MVERLVFDGMQRRLPIASSWYTKWIAKDPLTTNFVLDRYWWEVARSIVHTRLSIHLLRDREGPRLILVAVDVKTQMTNRHDTDAQTSVFWTIRLPIIRITIWNKQLNLKHLKWPYLGSMALVYFWWSQSYVPLFLFLHTSNDLWRMNRRKCMWSVGKLFFYAEHSSNLIIPA